MQVSDEGALNTRLISMGYQPVLVQVAPGAPAAVGRATQATRPQAPASPGPGTSPVRATERNIARMYQQLYISFRAGMPAFQALHTVSAQVADVGLRQVL